MGTIVSFPTSAQLQQGAQTGARTGSEASVQAGQTEASGNATASSSASLQSNQANAGLSSGTAFNATLSAPVDSKKAKPGDSVNARTTEVVKSDGSIVLPKGTKLVGHVTRASARAKGESESALAIMFDRAILKNGRQVAVEFFFHATYRTAGAAEQHSSQLSSGQSHPR
jgi:hypothetical protein